MTLDRFRLSVAGNNYMIGRQMTQLRKDFLGRSSKQSEETFLASEPNLNLKAFESLSRRRGHISHSVIRYTNSGFRPLGRT